MAEMDDWLNLNKPPCWDSIRDPYASEANPWTAGLRYLYVKKIASLSIPISPVDKYFIHTNISSR